MNTYNNRFNRGRGQLKRSDASASVLEIVMHVSIGRIKALGLKLCCSPFALTICGTLWNITQLHVGVYQIMHVNKPLNIGLQFLASGLSFCEKHMQNIT